ncbi:MAG: LytTR family DNA-binding domain-containing protein [Lachnospiraceae bacterium]|nr:LytTR family DNA-binding domain-containing protein [Lachnospiraceae bacterium]
MKISICDDEAAARELIANKVQRLCPGSEISFFASGEELLFAGDYGDILFLDIRLAGQDGMKTARALRKKDKHMILIFVTALKEYVFEAFDVGAFHYLVKPFDDAKFAEIFCLAVKQWEESERQRLARCREGEDFNSLKQDEETGQADRVDKERYLLVKNGGLSTKVLLDDIIYAEVFNRKITLHSRRGDLEYYGKLSELEKMAGEDFFRPHRAYLVNFKYVECYSATEIVMEKGRALMAKKNYSSFVKNFMRYNKKEG